MNYNLLIDENDVTACCDNCRFDGENFTCKCKQKFEDRKAGKEKEKVNDFCGYFEPIFTK